MSKPVVLIIRDGWGVNPSGEAGAEKEGNATLLAKTPCHDHLYATYPVGYLSASGGDVGLPDGQMGNSEVGHLNLGAGRIVYQDLSRINRTIEAGELGDNPILKEAFEKAQGKRLHLLGLISDGGVHSHQDHLAALVDCASTAGVEDIYIHAITDGRDTSPTGGQEYLKKLEADVTPQATIATVIGRYYAMDRDQRWDRSKIGWDAIVHGRGTRTEGSPSDAVGACYAQEETDEFIKPMTFVDHDTARIRDGDVVLWFNFRADRARQLSQAFLFEDFDGFERELQPEVHYVTFTQYDETYPCPVAFPPESIENGLGEVVSQAGLKQLRIAESEKYPHVTYFFNGGIEEPFEGQTVHRIPSPKVATYDLQPEMNASTVTDNLVERLADYDLVILNFANPDMVGHTGIIDAATTAVEAIDSGVQKIVDRVLELEGKLLITADHGNCEYMINPDGSPHTAHTTNLVHLLYVGADADDLGVQDGILADVSPTLLALLGVEQPPAMTGRSLLCPTTEASSDRPRVAGKRH